MRAGAVAQVELHPADLSAGTGAFVAGATLEDPDRTVVVLLRAYHRHDPDGGAVLAPGVVLLHGPIPSPPLPIASPDTTAGELVRIAGLSVGLMLVVGAGWTLAFGRWDPVVAVSLAPAVGAAVLVVVGLVAARVGVGFRDGGGTAIAAIAGVFGWIAWAGVRVRSATRSDARG